MKPSGWLWLAAGCLFVIGLFIGFSPVKSDGYTCGSAFHESKGLAVDELTDTMYGGTGTNGCDEARSNRQLMAWVPLLAAAGLGIGGVISRSHETDVAQRARANATK